MNWVSIIGFAAIGQSILLATKYAIGKRTQLQKLLILLFSTLALYQLHEVLVQSQLIVKYTWLYGWGPLFPLLIAPLLYLYVQSILNARFHLRFVDLFHMIPFLLAFSSRVDLIFQSTETKAQRLKLVFENQSFSETAAFHSFDFEDFTHFLFWHLQPIIYFILIVIIIVKAKEKIYSTKKLANWLKILAFGLLIYFMGDYLTEIFLPHSIGRHKLYVEIPLFSLYIHVLCLLVIQASSTYSINAISEDTMNKREIEDHYERLLQLVNEKKLFLKPQLQLAELAAELGLQGRDLSLVIKKGSGLSYTDYINKLRIEYSKQLMQNPKYHSYTISAIGEESGFKSKDAFYRAFRKISKMTPKAFLDSLKRPNS